MFQQRGPRHAPRFQIVEQRRALAFRHRLAAARDEDAQLFKQFTRSPADHRCGGRIGRVSDVDFSVSRVDLPAGKRMKATEKSEFVTALDPENFRILRICVLPEKNYRRRVFGNCAHDHLNLSPSPGPHGTPRM